MTKVVEVCFLGRDRVNAEFEFDSADLQSGRVTSLSLKASGCSRFLETMSGFRSGVLAIPLEERSLSKLKLLAEEMIATMDSCDEHVVFLLRELVLRAGDEFGLPYVETELCHCRSIPTAVVDRAILSGCLTVQSVARATSAGTSCGTCKPDTEKLIAYRQKKLI
ncbi:MAG: (2Fe-2S)-binding protein [Bdellovibrionales bacterium]|jgi:bacterioferritin-associated ferredoxin|nr:(2Fe-2S)-binding protein [Bdellovibrionales bacterium]